VPAAASDWPAFWGQLAARLRQDGYRPNTLRVYRQVLRDLRQFLRDRHGRDRPDGLSAERAVGFLESLCERNVSWSWMASAPCHSSKVGTVEVVPNQTVQVAPPAPAQVQVAELIAAGKVSATVAPVTEVTVIRSRDVVGLAPQGAE
jgi:hypothetical protein